MAIQHDPIAQPTELPVSLAEAKEELELIGHAHDSKVTRQISAARIIWERHTKRAAVRQQWAFTVESDAAAQDYENLVGGPAGGRSQTQSLMSQRRVIELPRVPFVSVDAVQSKEKVTDVYATTDAEDYTVETTQQRGRVIWNSGVSLPPFRKITYTCGYAAGELPADYQETILKLVVFLFECRGDVESKLPTSIVGEMSSQKTGTLAGYWG